MGSIGAFLESQPFIALFLVVCLGYAVGKISIAGLSLGSGAVLFVGLAVGAIALGALSRRYRREAVGGWGAGA